MDVRMQQNHQTIQTRL